MNKSTKPTITPGLTPQELAELLETGAIYIRTSSEHQAEKSSPEEQEKDCRRAAEEHGIKVVGVYRDIERYRVKNRMVDPSGTRDDRPGLRTMLQDAASGKFRWIIAWREDRLYRGMKAMIVVLDAIQEHKLNVLLAKESFDAKLAPLKAWVAGMELDGMKERMDMGVKARLGSGKANTGQDRYGYKRVGDVIIVVEEEAKWVRLIFKWYIERIPLMEIRARLIQGEAPQKGSSRQRKKAWAITTIQGILKGAEAYATGVKKQSRKGEVYEIKTEPLIDMATYQKFLEVRESNKKHPVHHLEHEYLCSGKIYCACGHKWGARVSSYTRKNRKGEKVERKTLYGTYYCPERIKEAIHCDCPRTIGSNKADDIVWQKVSNAISNPEVLFAQAQRYVDNIRQQSGSTEAEIKSLQEDLDAIALERQWVITQARKGRITDEDMEYQLGSLKLQEMQKRQAIAAHNELIQLSAAADWDVQVRDYLEDLRAGLESLNAAPQSDEERREVFELKKRFVQALVDRIEIDKERGLNVVLRLKVLGITQHQPNFCAIQPAGTCTRKPASPVRPHPSGCGG